VLMSDQGSHFLNETIQQLTQEFMIHHQKITPYHPQANDAVESFNKILDHALTKVFNVQRDD
jgi:transposase InsO family protein